MKGYVYIRVNRKNGAIYTGFTKDLHARLLEHKNKVDPKSFTARYDVTTLVYLEVYDLVADAIAREKQVKNWKRKWKIALWEESNPHWAELQLDWRDLE